MSYHIKPIFLNYLGMINLNICQIYIKLFFLKISILTFFPIFKISKDLENKVAVIRGE